MEEPITQEPTSIEKIENNYNELKAANDKVEAELLRGEQLKATIALGGKSSAGQAPPEPPKPETDKEYTERIMRGDLKETEGTPYNG